MPRGRRLVPREDKKREPLTPEQRLLLLDTWQRSGLPARDFSGIVGLSPHTLYAWKKRFQRYGPAGLMDRPRGGPRGSRLPEVTKRAILLLKREHPDWGCQRISDMLLRGPALPASPSAVVRVLKESGYELEEVHTAPHPPRVRRFERDRAGQLWQTDIFTFVLKRQNRRVYLVAFLDDYSRYIVGWGLHATASTALVLEVLRSAITSYGPPEEVLTDNGSQYVTWRGKSAFAKECERRGIQQIVSRPRHPQTLGKIERFWGTLWRDCVEGAIFADLGDAQQRIGHFVDHYNFQRTHQGIDGLVPADRFFGAESKVRAAVEERVASNALELARDGVPKEPFYLTGKVGGKSFSVHAEGERVILTPDGGERREIELVAPAREEGREDDPPERFEEQGEDRTEEESPGTPGTEGPGREPPGASEGSGDPGGARRGEDAGGGVPGDWGDAEPVLLPGDPGPGGVGGGVRVEVGGPEGLAGEGAGAAEGPDPTTGAGAGEVPGPRPGGGESRGVADAETVEKGGEAEGPSEA
jgi:transposase InsO family protein